MIYNEQDIDFQTISDRRFEELCFDLLLRLGFTGLTWRQGSADSGRDIEGSFHITNPLIESYDEKWFFECKNWKTGLPVTEFGSKIAWADAERPKHLVVMTSSHITNDTRIWLDKLAIQKSYSIHVIEGKFLKKILLSYSDLIANYFGDKYSKLLREAQRNCFIHDLLPDPGTLNLLSVNLSPSKLTREEIAFLLASVLLLDSDILSWCEDNVYFNMDHIFANLQNYSNSKKPLLNLMSDDYAADAWAFSNCAYLSSYGAHSSVVTLLKHALVSSLLLNYKEEPKKALYIFVATSDIEAIELLIEVTGDFSTTIRTMKVEDGKNEYMKIVHVLIDHNQR